LNRWNCDRQLFAYAFSFGCVDHLAGLLLCHGQVPFFPGDGKMSAALGTSLDLKRSVSPSNHVTMSNLRRCFMFFIEERWGQGPARDHLPPNRNGVIKNDMHCHRVTFSQKVYKLRREGRTHNISESKSKGCVTMDYYGLFTVLWGAVAYSWPRLQMT
jgi:hypothetical protein